MSEVTVHLTRAYRYAEGSEAGGRRIPSVPVTACGDGGEQVSVCPDGDGEDRISCEACLAWLAQGDNRLHLLDADEWIRRNAGRADIRYIDIEVTADGDDQES